MPRGGSKPKTRGNQMETQLTPLFKQMPHCSIIKIEAPFKIVGYSRGSRQKQAFGYPEAKGGCDYEGGFKGIHSAIEAKRHDGKERRWNFKSNIAQHQQDRMRRAHYFKEISGIILCWDMPTDYGRVPQRWFWIPYALVHDAQEAGTKSWRLADIENYLHPSGAGIRELRWNALQTDLGEALVSEAAFSLAALCEAHRGQ